MTGEYEEKKAAYENLAAGLESNMSKLEQVIEPPLLQMNLFPLHSHVYLFAMLCQHTLFSAQTSFLMFWILHHS